MENKFVKADSGNLPKVTALMVGLFFKTNPDFYAPELSNVKSALASRESYGDDAVGYVQLCREAGICTLKCKMCPEHKVRASGYSVSLTVDEENETIVSCQCHDCAASAGGCKHAVAFLMWAHRRSEEPACTSVECYWRKSTLSRVGTSLKFITLEELSRNKRITHRETRTELLSEFLHEAKKRKIENCELLKYQRDHRYDDMKQFSMHHFLIQTEDRKDVNKVLDLMRLELAKQNGASLIEESTRMQHNSKLWHELRYGRITASKAYEASQCHTPDGSLVAAIMGAKTPDTTAMKRGRKLEASVKKTVETKLKKKFKTCGLFLIKEYPMIAATPDGICTDAVLEVKCPTSNKTKQNYINDNKITNKYLAQVQLQMFATNKNQCYFCVAHEDFETSKNVDVTVINFDDEYVKNLLNKIVSFWKANIYTLLTRCCEL